MARSTVTPYLADPDFALHNGDALEVLQGMPAESVDCALTSPPFYGLRDYSCEGQIGLEATPDQWCDRLVQVFREVRRVLKPAGTLWIECGDSYNGPPSGRTRDDYTTTPLNPDESARKYEAGHGHRKARDLKSKDLLGSPWLLAFALRADGWYLRQAIIWHKPNPMPESVTDRCTTAHSYVFLLSKSPRYWFDAEAISEPAEWARWGDQTNGKYEGTESAGGWIPARTKTKKPDGWDTGPGGHGTIHRDGREKGAITEVAAGRKNARSVWTIATEGFPEAHFATFPQALVERILKAGCPEQVCNGCGKARERLVERQNESTYAQIKREHGITYQDMKAEAEANGITPGNVGGTHAPGQRGATFASPANETVGWSDCGCGQGFTPGVCLDVFMGSGTTALVARRLGRHSIGIELNPDYCQLAAQRLNQQSLLV